MIIMLYSSLFFIQVFLKVMTIFIYFKIVQILNSQDLITKQVMAASLLLRNYLTRKVSYYSFLFSSIPYLFRERKHYSSIIKKTRCALVCEECHLSMFLELDKKTVKCHCNCSVHVDCFTSCNLCIKID